MLVIDSHCDTPSYLLRGRDLSLDNAEAQVDFPKLRSGGVDASFFALYTPAELSSDEAAARALKMAAYTLDAVSREQGVGMAYSPEDILTNKSKGLISILFGMENGSPIGDSLPMLRLFYRLGVRYMTLTHNGDNLLGDAACEGTHWHGLSPFGREVVVEMNRLGMIVDVAHCSDETFYDCIRVSSKPVVSTHSCCRALASHRRNMTDDMIRTMSNHGGVIQINFYPLFLSDSEVPRPGVKEVVDHIDHAVKIGGIDHVGLGTDFDGIEVTPEGLENISLLPRVFSEMSHRGYSDTAIEKVAGLNFLRVFKDVARK